MKNRKRNARSILYWKQREAEALEHYVSEEEEYQRILNSYYDDMLTEIQRDIDEFYRRYADKEGISLAEAKERVKNIDIKEYERLAQRYVKEKNFSDKANEEMRIYNAAMRINRLEMLKARIGLRLVSGHDSVDKDLKEWLLKRAEDEAKRQAGILGKSAISDPSIAEAIINASFHNATFSERILASQGALRDEISRQLLIGITQGKNPRELARGLRKIFDVSKYNAERLMRTEMARVQTDIQMRSFDKNGFDEYEFIANENDGKTCDICKGLDGKIFKVIDMQTGENAPPVHPNCRCSTAAYMDDKAYNDWLDGYQEHGLSFEDWQNENFIGVKDMKWFAHEGTKYKVDGKNILLDHSDKERKVAETLSKHFKATVQLIPRISKPQGIKTPDYVINGKRYDLKEPIGSGKHTLYGMINNKKRQSDNFVFDISNCPLSMGEIESQIFNDIYRSKHTSFVNEIIIIKNNKIIQTYIKK